MIVALARILLVLLVSLMGPTGSDAQVRKVEMTKAAGVYMVPCHVNGLPMSFIFDTGASGISLSKEAAKLMVEKGAIKEKDVLGSEYFRIANGDVVEGIIVQLRSFEIAGARVKDIKASVSLSLEAPMLLGTDVLERFGKVTIDYSNNVLLLGEEPNLFLEEMDKLFRLHKYTWGSTSEDVEALEKSEKLRVKLVSGSFTDWKHISSDDGSISMSYKQRVAGLALKKSYDFENNGLNLEHIDVLKEGIQQGNPDTRCMHLPLSDAYRIFQKFDSLVRSEARFTGLSYCIAKDAYSCVHSPYSNEPAYGSFYEGFRSPLDLGDESAFQTTMSHYFSEHNSGVAQSSRQLQVIVRRHTFNNDGYYDLCIRTTDAVHYDVWLVIRKA
jgi:clan AA aspartic protease (TIGR02281 family)